MSQSEQHSEIAQEPYRNQIGNMGPGYSPVRYIQTQYGMKRTSIDQPMNRCVLT